MNPTALAKWMEKNEDIFEKAREKHENRKALRKEKRAKERSRLRERNRRLVVDDSEDDIPFVQRRQTKNPSPELDQHDDGLFVKDSAMVRRAPLDQSTDDDEDDGTDSAEESNDKARPKNTMGAHFHNNPGLGNSILRPKISADEASRPEPHGQGKPQPRKPSGTLTTPVFSTNPQVSVLQQGIKRGSESAAKKPTVAPAREVDASQRKSSAPTIAPHHPTKPAKPATQTVTEQPPESIAPASRKNGTASKLTNPIRIINGPKDAPRKPWNSKDKPYKKIKFRGIAENRARTEGTPDLDALEFVGARPSDLPKPRTADSADNPYGRGEAGTHRVQEFDNDNDTSREYRIETSPLREWEAGKVPQMCAQWRLSNSCQLGAQKCKFLHRDKDETGRPIPVGREDRLVPPKLRNKPLTCLFWLENREGCVKSAAQCIYAHHNTGWKADGLQSSTAVQIGSNILPVSERCTKRLETKSINSVQIDSNVLSVGEQVTKQHEQITKQREQVTKQSEKNNTPDMTCWFWTRNSCTRAKKCKYKHVNTGTIAIPPAKSFCRYFLEGRCHATAETCKYYHPEEENGSIRHDTINHGASFFLTEMLLKLTRV
jgi:chromo domain-containing protein 1